MGDCWHQQKVEKEYGYTDYVEHGLTLVFSLLLKLDRDIFMGAQAGVKGF